MSGKETIIGAVLEKGNTWHWWVPSTMKLSGWCRDVTKGKMHHFRHPNDLKKWRRY